MLEISWSQEEKPERAIWVGIGKEVFLCVMQIKSVRWLVALVSVTRFLMNVGHLFYPCKLAILVGCNLKEQMSSTQVQNTAV